MPDAVVTITEEAEKDLVELERWFGGTGHAKLLSRAVALFEVARKIAGARESVVILSEDGQRSALVNLRRRLG